MPLTLPTIVIQDDAVAAIVLDTFKGEVDSSGAPITPQAAYRLWLREQLIAKVSYKRSQDKRVAREIADNADIETERVKLSSI